MSAEGGAMGQTTEDLQEELNSALRRAETAEYWIERNADFLRERDEFISKDRAMSYRDVDGNACDGNGRALGEPPERDHGLVSISEMNRRIAEAVTVERGTWVRLLEAAQAWLAAHEEGMRSRADAERVYRSGAIPKATNEVRAAIAAKIRERGAKL